MYLILGQDTRDDTAQKFLTAGTRQKIRISYKMPHRGVGSALFDSGRKLPLPSIIFTPRHPISGIAIHKVQYIVEMYPPVPAYRD